MSAATAARRLSAIRQFHRFLLNEGVRGHDPTGIVDGPKKGRALPKILSEKDVDRLLAVARERTLKPTLKPTRPGARLGALRMHALLEVLYATGLRGSELVGLPVSAARGEKRALTVRGKGGKERMVPLTPAAGVAMAAYLPRRRRRGMQGRGCSRGGESISPGRPSRGLKCLGRWRRIAAANPPHAAACLASHSRERRRPPGGPAALATLIFRPRKSTRMC
jgi:site-specific recombinase XerD